MEPETYPIAPIHTPCKECSFAKYESNTQVGCSLDLLEKYRTKGLEILEAYDDDKEFFVINGKKCSGYKDTKYFTAKKLDSLSLEDKIDYVKKLMTIKYIMVVNLKTLTIEQLGSLVNKIKVLDIKPKKIVLIRYPEDKDTYSLKIVKDLLNDLNIEWRLQSVLNDDTIEYVLHHIILSNKNYNFVVFVNECNELSPLINKAQKSVYDDFETFAVLSTPTKQTILFNNAVYRMNAFYEIDILENKDSYTII